MNAPAPIDPQVIRRDFAIFERDFDGRSVAYLDSAATALKPQCVVDRLVHVHAKDISVEQSESERGKVTGTPVGCARTLVSRLHDLLRVRRTMWLTTRSTRRF